MKKQCCKTCLFSRWNLTPTGRISKDSSGRCVVEFPFLFLPDCVTKAYGFKKEPARTYVSQDWGGSCPLYQENQGKPIS
jgi:hypothetical protein